MFGRGEVWAINRLETLFKVEINAVAIVSRVRGWNGFRKSQNGLKNAFFVKNLQKTGLKVVFLVI